MYGLTTKTKPKTKRRTGCCSRKKDSFAKDTSGLTGRERSVKSGLSAKGIAEKAAVAAAEIPLTAPPVML